MNKFINSMPKEPVYHLYAKCEENPIDYEKITKVKMMEAVRHLVRSNKALIEEILSLEELNRVISKDLRTYGGSINELFLYEKIEEDHFVMYPEFEAMVDALVITDTLRERDYYKRAVKGMLQVYGGLPFTTIETFYEQGRDKAFEDLPIPTIMNVPFFVNDLFFDGYGLYKGVVIHPVMEESGMKPFLSNVGIKYPIQTYVDIFDHGASDEFIEKYYPESSDKRSDLNMVRHVYLSFIQGDDHVVETLSKIANGEVLEPYFLIEPYYEQLLDWPIWQFDGLSYNQYNDAFHTDVLDDDKQESFISFISEITTYGNRKYRYFKNVRTVEQLIKTVDSDQAFDILNDSLVHPKFAEQFIASGTYTSGPHIQEYLQSARKAIVMKRAFAYGIDNGLLAVYFEGVVYHVKGITQPIYQVIFPQQLPTFIDLVIFPLSDCITYGVSIRSMEIGLGSGIKDIFEKEIQQAEHKYSIDDFNTVLRS